MWIELLTALLFCWFTMAWFPCEACYSNCSPCPDARAGAQYKVVIAGLTDSTCLTCTDYNGSWFLPFAVDSPNTPPAVGGNCYYILQGAEGGMPNSCTPLTDDSLKLAFEGPAGVGTHVNLIWNASAQVVWQNANPVPDCDALVDHNVVFGFKTGSLCGGTLTCLITSLP